LFLFSGLSVHHQEKDRHDHAPGIITIIFR
jgi:hypothetical protein